ncbi:hypothetical protein ACFQZT_03765 [Paenibacillus sp. GCM10027628]|uniref:hypothetical protein n=1 Tax=Paenibacillus sp. GCM10027628 TaxID=3273413 RepID=UPI00362DBC1A
MAHQVISEEEFRLLLSSDYRKEEKESLEKPKLTMKFLHELIRKLQHENLVLAKRIVELEQQLDSFHRIQVEVAATVELPAPAEADAAAAGTDITLDTFVPQKGILIPRSERHATEKKKSFWNLWFRPNAKESKQKQGAPELV